ncbi:MAG: twin-arginine translocase TatA/TatE family subunit [Alphaproteobacteria bacterium]|nr:twin-arginine translocase TatA/TatE family subunit [Alphaproteobacteria bacterium]MBN2779681.1 twin-arginine translocase TatA/TatE family subunit [Alphaproteobacteria bacterium]
MMPHFWELLLILVIVVLLFGSGKISTLMADFAKGIKAFKTGLKDEPVKTKSDAKKTTKPSVKKAPVAKKTTTKKPVAKKPVAKKATAKKPVAKKTTKKK